MPFVRDVVEQIEEGQIGCYGLLKDDEVIYVGAGEIRGSLLKHLDGEPPSLRDCPPTHWIGAAVPDPHGLLPELLEEYRPRCNEPRAGSAGPFVSD